ncbi:MAG TPA: hypothetical protein VJJ78_04610 [Candidatus Saccharimonadales bacterium]|nr:hypothetical protein [Candidatus Saccharimonadales bacterium]
MPAPSREQFIGASNLHNSAIHRQGLANMGVVRLDQLPPVEGEHETVLGGKLGGVAMQTDALKPVSTSKDHDVLAELGVDEPSDSTETHKPDALVLRDKTGGLSVLTKDMEHVPLDTSGNPGSETYVPIGKSGVKVSQNQRSGKLSVSRAYNGPKKEDKSFGDTLATEPVKILTNR